MEKITILKISFFVCIGIIIIINILEFLYSVTFSLTLLILDYICLIHNCAFYLFLVIYSFFANKEGCIYIAIPSLSFCLGIIMEPIVIGIKNSEFKLFLKNYPFMINDDNYTLNVDKRCQLYNINNNSRFSYQYICNYNSSSIGGDMWPNEVICVELKNIIKENEKIYNFTEKYFNNKNYYCSRTNFPKYPLIKNIHTAKRRHKLNQFFFAFRIISAYAFKLSLYIFFFGHPQWKGE